MFSTIRPALTAAGPVLARTGLTVWGYTVTAASFVVVSTSVYVIGRTTAELCESGAARLIDKLHATATKLADQLDPEPLKKANGKLSKKAVEADLARRVEQEIARRIEVGELLVNAKAPLHSYEAAPAG